MTGQHGGGAWISFQAPWEGNEELAEGQASVWPMSGRRPERRRLLWSRHRGRGGLVWGSGVRGGEKEADGSEFSSAFVVSGSPRDDWMPC